MQYQPKNQLHSVDEFLRSAPKMFKMSAGQVKGFRSLMKFKGKMWTFNLRNYIPYLKHYLHD